MRQVSLFHSDVMSIEFMFGVIWRWNESRFNNNTEVFELFQVGVLVMSVT